MGFGLLRALEPHAQAIGEQAPALIAHTDILFSMVLTSSCFIEKGVFFAAGGAHGK